MSLKATGMYWIVRISPAFVMRRSSVRLRLQAFLKYSELCSCMIKKIQNDFFESFNVRQLRPLLELYSESALIHSLEGPLYGPESIQKIIDRWLIAFPDLQLLPLHTSQENDVIVIHWRAHGTHKEPLLHLPATNRQTTFHGLTCFRISENKVIEHWACTDYRSIQACQV